MHLISSSKNEAFFELMIQEACEQNAKDLKLHISGFVTKGMRMTREEIEKSQKTFEDLRALVRSPVARRKPLEKYQDAEIESFYVHSYSRYSKLIHGNIFALLENHAEGYEVGDVVISKNCSDLEFITTAMELIEILSNSVSIVVSSGNLGRCQGLDEFEKAIDFCKHKLSTFAQNVMQ